MRALTLEPRAERAHEQRVREALEQRRLAAQALQGAGVLGPVGPQDLDDHERAQAVIPGEVGLIADAAAEQADGAAPRDDLVALAEVPGLHGAERARTA